MRACFASWLSEECASVMRSRLEELKRDRDELDRSIEHLGSLISNTLLQAARERAIRVHRGDLVALAGDIRNWVRRDAVSDKRESAWACLGGQRCPCRQDPDQMGAEFVLRVADSDVPVEPSLCDKCAEREGEQGIRRAMETWCQRETYLVDPMSLSEEWRERLSEQPRKRTRKKK